jgi:hypothetical protein
MERTTTGSRTDRNRLMVFKNNKGDQTDRTHKFQLKLNKSQVNPTIKHRILLSYDMPPVSSWRQLARVLDLRGSLDEWDWTTVEEMRARRLEHATEEAAVNEIQGCWVAVGRHLWKAIGAYKMIEDTGDGILSDVFGERTE